ncbi:MAG: hypothetical protein NTX28_01345 [Novosphingobium sp.]|nr:hypothetical protein [Novosphingobium sp.]
MNRKPIFDAVRTMVGGSLTQAQVDTLNLAFDLAEAGPGLPEAKPARPVVVPVAPAAPAPAPVAAPPAHRLGALSQKYESGNGGPGTVSSGSGDPGGVSYGTYQLSSAAGTLDAFVKAEGKPWADKLAVGKGGTAAFSAAWKQIAKDMPEAFGAAQHAFIERTHYRPAVASVIAARHLDLDSRHDAVRDATWSVAVQHARAVIILTEAINACDLACARTDPAYDRKLVESIYKRRTDYVLGVAANPKLKKAEQDQLISITKNRYPAELAQALAMIDARPAAPLAPAPVVPAPVAPAPAPAPDAGGSVDGNVIAAANGVGVKSAAVKISKLHPKMEAVIVTVAKVVRTLGLPTPVITSGNDSKHMNGSLHYSWRALDFRGNNVTVAIGKKFAQEVSASLGKDYDVAFETFLNASNNHLHVEYDAD